MLRLSERAPHRLQGRFRAEMRKVASESEGPTGAAENAAKQVGFHVSSPLQDGGFDAVEPQMSPLRYC